MKRALSLLLLILPLTGISQQNINLQLVLEKGDKYSIERELNSVTTQVVTGETQIIKKTDSSLYEFEIIEKPTDSTFYIKIAYKRFKTIIEAKEETNSFDTDNIKDEENPLEKLYLSLTGNDIYCLISDKGRHIRTDSLDAFYESFESVTGSDAETLNSFKDMFNVNALKDLIPIVSFPDKDIKLNESWTLADTSSTGILNFMNKRYTLKKVKDDSYIIVCNSDIQTDKNKILPLKNVFLIYDLTGTMQGTEIRDYESCMLVQSDITQDASGIVSLKYNKNSEPAYTWPIQIQNIIKTKVTKINSNEE